jgi:alkanesulfonate monooxygenase SsuD/methylene tetrahydromethanopterin reductase-like flavin-dependent oxidoreductase (luciferase family)
MMSVTADARERGRMLAESIEMIERIWASDPPYEIDGKYWTVRIKDAVNPALNFGWLPKPYQKPRPPIAIPCATPDSASVAVAGRKGWSVISSALLSGEDLARHWRMYREGCAQAGREARGEDWRVCRTIHVAGSDEEARARIYHPESGYRQFYGHMHKVYRQLGRLGVFKSRADMCDDEVTVDTLIEQRTIFGSPKTVLAELAALRRSAGPFGTLLVSAIDWSGPNAAWERESLRRLAEDVMPALRAQSAAA